ncbi:MAG: Trm112 family protein [Pseudomonadota bacterium]
MSDTSDAQTAKPDPHMLDLLICPVSRGRLEYDRDAQELISRKAGLAYPIRDGVPIMLEDEARQLDDKP